MSDSWEHFHSKGKEQGHIFVSGHLCFNTSIFVFIMSNASSDFFPVFFVSKTRHLFFSTNHICLIPGIFVSPKVYLSYTRCICLSLQVFVFHSRYLSFIPGICLSCQVFVFHTRYLSFKPVMDLFF